ncbi:MAG TPA: DUF2784 family protein [Rhodocyclaceae bacterium]|nr:DUF2784 family protein [Rhodocyclaceae bacterium]
MSIALTMTVSADALADGVLVLHAIVALFITSGFVFIPVGAARRWAWIRRRSYRIAHLFAIGLVAVEALIGLSCPLTVLEDALRGDRSGRAFIARVLAELLYWRLPDWVFALLYVSAASCALWLWLRVPPRRA